MEKHRVALKLLVVGLLLVGLVSSSEALTPSQAIEPGTLFGVAYLGQDGPARLYTIDPSTGDATPFEEGIGFERCSGMDFDSFGTLYATCEQPDDTRVLIKIDPATGKGYEVVGPIDISGCCGQTVVHDLSARSDDTLFGHLGPFSHLATFELTTGAASSIGEINVNNGNGLAFSADDTLYNWSRPEGEPTGRLYILDSSDGSPISFISTTFPSPANQRPRINAMAFMPGTDILFASLNHGTSELHVNYLAIVDIDTGDVKIIGQTVDGLDAIAFFDGELPSTSDLIAQKSNDINGLGEMGTPFNWTIEVANTGGLDATFNPGDVILQDTLPDSPTYGPPTPSKFFRITGRASISCGIENHTLTCAANGEPVTIEGQGSFDVVFSVTPTVPGMLDNPTQDGMCRVDPGNTVDEVDEDNNNCADRVTVKEKKPTAIDLVSFAVEASGGQAVVTWETATEIDNAGFNIYRALSPDGPWMQVNSVLIVAEGDPVSGAHYSFTDTPGRGTFYYLLEDIDFFGTSTLHEPALVEMGAAIRIPWYRPIPPEF